MLSFIMTDCPLLLLCLKVHSSLSSFCSQCIPSSEFPSMAHSLVNFDHLTQRRRRRLIIYFAFGRSSLILRLFCFLESHTSFRFNCSLFCSSFCSIIWLTPSFIFDPIHLPVCLSRERNPFLLSIIIIFFPLIL